MMSLETLLLFKEILNGLTLNVGAPDFQVLAQRVVTAQNELDRAIVAHQALANHSAVKPKAKRTPDAKPVG